MKKSIIIGLDGAPYSLFKKWIEENKFPFLKKIKQKGVFGILETVIPPYTMIAWPCFYTGKNPGKIGPFMIKGEGFDPDAFSKSSFMNSYDIKTFSIWEYLSERNYKVGVMNVPVTYPPKKVNGFLVSDFLTPKGASDFYYPEKLKEILKNYKIKSEISTGFGYKDKDLNKDYLYKMFSELLKNRIEHAIKLISTEKPDFFMIDFKEIDDFMHFFFDNKEKVIEFFKKAEKGLEEIVNLINPDIILIMSDHGFHHSPRRYFYINTWLLKKGYLEKSKSIKGGISRYIYNIGVYTVKKLGWIRNLVPEKLKFKIARGEMKRRVDWESTKVYANWYAGLYFNPRFFKKEEEKEKLAKELKEALLDLKDPENENKKPILKAFTKYEYLSGPFFDIMPEVVYTTTPEYKINVNIFDKVFDEIIERPAVVGHHTGDLEGIYIFAGKPFEENKEGPKLSIIDAIPNFLFALGEPVLKDMDGKVNKELFKKDYKDKKVEFIELQYKEYKERKMDIEEEESIKEHLKGLGYI